MPEISIRPMQKEDVPFITKYFYECNDDDLDRMGVDKSKLISKDEYNRSLLQICNTPIETTTSFYLIWLIDNIPVGHNALKDILRNEIAHMHLHMWNENYRGQGLGSRLFCMCSLEFFRLFNLKTILCEPSEKNIMPNKALTKIGYKKWKTYYSKSSELSLATNLNSYVIDKETSALFLKGNNASQKLC